MKQKLFILLGFLFCISSICSLEQQTNNFRVEKIKKHKSFYLLEASRNDSLFKIIAIINESPKETQKIRKGKMCDLELTRAFPSSDFVSYNEISYFVFDNVKIKLDKKHHQSVYYAKNLNGLFLIKME